MTKSKMERVTLPLGEMPKGRGWQLWSGNTFQNTWERKRPKKRGPTRDQLVESIQRLYRNRV